jgi:hypothetical protein
MAVLVLAHLLNTSTAIDAAHADSLLAHSYQHVPSDSTMVVLVLSTEQLSNTSTTNIAVALQTKMRDGVDTRQYILQAVPYSIFSAFSMFRHPSSALALGVCNAQQ